MQSVAQAHAALRAHTDLQFDLAAAKPVEPPAWLVWLSQHLQFVAPMGTFLFWACIIVGAALIIYLIARTVLRNRTRHDVAPVVDEVAAWRPEEKAARALLAEAEDLAAQGQFGQAVHLLLHRSIEDIQRRRPRDLRPALTSREIAGAAWMPTLVRSAFGLMATLVERSLFAGGTLERGDWENARGAYSEFALPRSWK